MRTINVVGRYYTDTLHRQLPDGNSHLDGWKFLLNDYESPCDYLVVVDNLPHKMVPKCTLENIIHLATEPPSVRKYHKIFLDQFAWVITQDPDIEHSAAIHSHPANTWFIGFNPREAESVVINEFCQVKPLFDLPKSKNISIVSSTKDLTPSHIKRLSFAQRLKEYYGDRIDFYGRGVLTMHDKLESLSDYRFQVVIENSVHEHYFTEKITDCILAGTYPIYYGCPNISDYLPDNSYTTIDINDFEGAIATINYAINNDIDRKYRKELLEARDLLLYKHNIFPMLTDMINRIEKGEFGKPQIPKLYGGKMLSYRCAGYYLRRELDSFLRWCNLR